MTPPTPDPRPPPLHPPPRPALRHGACALVLDADADLAGLIEQWLQPEGLQVHIAARPPTGAGIDLGDRHAIALVIVDLPFPSRADLEALRAQLAPRVHAPVLVLSTAVFASVDCRGPAARALGADGLLPKPTSGEALRRAVRSLIGA